MSSEPTSFADGGVSPAQRLEVLIDELSELCGQRNAIDGRIVDIVAELDRDELCGATGARSIMALVAWKTGVTPNNAETIVAVARRAEQFPLCTQALREGRLSLDQVGVIAERAADGSDEHYAQLAPVATVAQLRTAVKLEPKPEPQPDPEAPTEPEPVVPEPKRSFTKIEHDDSTTYQITLPRLEAAKLDAGVRSHQEALIAAWKRDHDAGDQPGEQSPPFPDTVDAFMSLVEAGWDADVAARPHGQHTTVVVHLDLDRDGEKPVAALHLGPVLTDAERRYLTCDATCEVWFERHGQAIGAGRTTRTISRRLRRALEYRDRCCAVPGCGATRGLQAHHIVHWEDGGPTELGNAVLLCAFHHRLHHRGLITITGPSDRLKVTDATGRELHGGSLARPPTTPPPNVPPYRGPTGERADWWWYTPFQPQPPPSPN